MSLHRSIWPLALLVTGCAVAVVPLPRADGARATAASKKAPAGARPLASATPAEAAAPAKASPKPSPAPPALVASAPPIVAAPAIARPSAPALAGLKFPTKILPALPAAFAAAGASRLIGNDGGTLISDDGSTLVGNDGGSLIGNDGGSLIGNDGGTYRLAQAADPEAVPTCGPVDHPGETSALIRDQFAEFVGTCEDIEGRLRQAAELGLQPGVPQAFDEVVEQTGQTRTMSVVFEPRGQGGVLRFAIGRTVTKENFTTMLTFTSPDEGVVVERAQAPQLDFTIGVRVAFDHVKGVVESDSALRFVLEGVEKRAHRRVAVVRLAAATPADPFLRVTAGTSLLNPSSGCAEERSSLAIHYLADQRSAMQLAKANAPGMPLAYLGLAQVRAAEPGPTTGFYVDKDKAGTWLDGATAIADLAPALPGKDLMPEPPPLLDAAAILADPRFALSW